MRNISGRLRHIIQLASMLLKLIVDAVCYLGLCLRPNSKLAAEVLFLRKQLALYEERQAKPRRPTDATRIVMVWLSHCPADHAHRIVIHDRDAIFSKEVDQTVRHMGVHVIKTPVRTPMAHAICERVVGTMRRECLDFVIPLNEQHLYGILKEWVAHDNQGRPHMSLGPGMPQPLASIPAQRQPQRYLLSQHQRVRSRSIRHGMHHEYEHEEKAA